MTAGRPKGTGRPLVAVRRVKVSWTIDPVLRQQVAVLAREAGIAESVVAENAMKVGLQRLWQVETSGSPTAWIVAAANADEALQTVIDQFTGSRIWPDDVLTATPMRLGPGGLLAVDGTAAGLGGSIRVGAAPALPLHPGTSPEP